MARNRGATSYQDIQRHIVRHEILAGGLNEGELLPSTRDLARRYHSNRMTVLRALDALAEAGILESRSRKGVFLKSRTRSQALLRTGRLGIIVPTLDYFYNEVVQGILGAMGARGDKPVLRTCGWEGKGLPAHLRELSGEFGCDGIILRAPSEVLRRALLAWPAHERVPLVLIDTELAEFPQVVLGDYGGAREAVGRLIKLGHRNIGFFTLHDIKNGQRLKGYHDELAAHGIAPAAGLVQASTMPRGGEARWRQSIRKMLDMGATSFFCYNDPSGVFLLQTLRTAGVEVPRQASVIAWDNASSDAGTTLLSAAGLRVSSMDPQKALLGETALRLLILALRAPSPHGVPREIVPPVFVDHGTVARPPSGDAASVKQNPSGSQNTTDARIARSRTPTRSP